MNAVKEEGTVPVTVRLPCGTRAGVRQVLDHERARRAAMAAPPGTGAGRQSRRRLVEARTAWREALALIRREGDLLDTLDALALFGVRCELRARGWDHRWPPCPPAARCPGRWPGSREGGYPEQLSFRLPAAVVAQVRAACWYTSAAAITELLEWQDRHRLTVRKRRRPSAELQQALDTYDRLADRVTTTGAIWRAGLRRGMETAARRITTPPPPCV